MAVTVKIPTQLRAATGGLSDIEAEGATVGDVLDSVFASHADLELINGEGRCVNTHPWTKTFRGQVGKSAWCCLERHRQRIRPSDDKKMACFIAGRLQHPVERNAVLSHMKLNVGRVLPVHDIGGSAEF